MKDLSQKKIVISQKQKKFLFILCVTAGTESHTRDTEVRERDRDRDRDRNRETFKRRGHNRDRDHEPPKRGHTVYVHGHSMAEEMIRGSFSKIGKIVNITMEPEKRCAESGLSTSCWLHTEAECTGSLFCSCSRLLGRARQSRDGLMESCTCRRAGPHLLGGPLPPHRADTPAGLTPLAQHDIVT